jgi:hypothetical protein
MAEPVHLPLGHGSGLEYELLEGLHDIWYIFYGEITAPLVKSENLVLSSQLKAGCQNGSAHASTPDVTSARRSAAL